MDVGADNFRFNLDLQNGLAQDVVTAREPQTYCLHMDSLDRYLPSEFRTTATFTNFPNSQTVSKTAGPVLLNSRQSGTDVQIANRRSLITGYFSRVAMTELQLQFRVPTVITGYNDLITFNYNTGGAGTAASITIPQGYYTYASMATYLQAQFRLIPALAAMTVTPPNVLDAGPLASVITGFTFTCNGGASMFFFYAGGGSGNQQSQEVVGRAFRMLGFNRACLGFTPEFFEGAQQTAAAVPWASVVGAAPYWLPTDYVDIVSQALTNYKTTKDTNSSLIAPQGLIARVNLAECPVNGVSSTSGVPISPAILGFGPFTFYKKWDNPNWSQWSPNQGIDQIDIKLLDMWGNTLFWTPTYATEWAATLTLTE